MINFNYPLKLLLATASLPALISLGGCMGSGYGCPLNDKSGYCASVNDTYHQARKGGGDSESVFAGMKPSQIHQNHSKKTKAEEAAEKKQLSFESLPSPPTGGKPVYKPGRPWRVWIAPWYDPKIKAMHGGSYVFFSTPSRWAYGTLNTPGVASGILGPISPHDLGFTASQQHASNAKGAKTQSQQGVTQPVRTFHPHK